MQRSKKAQEVHAEHLMKLSSGLFLAFFITILIVPMGAIIKGFVEPSGFHDITFDKLKDWRVIFFMVCEAAVVIIACGFHSKALDVYDKLYPNEC